MQHIPAVTFDVPGNRLPLYIERSAEGRLLRIEAASRVYVDSPDAGVMRFDGGFAQSEQVELPGGLLRRVSAMGSTWTELYRWDAKGLLNEIDGVEVGYDSEGRVMFCRGAAGYWDYAYSGAQLAVISTPNGLRRIVRDDTGRPLAYSQNGHTIDVRYDATGRRITNQAAPASWHRDAWGRLWTVTDDSGRVLLTYLWDGRHCLGVIGGELGGPMAAVYSLDPTGTPVRIVARDGVRRIPRDAFGEALLSVPGIPALFGGAVNGGLVQLPYRRLDPLTGSFDAPDPFDGEEQDPRRASGWTGPLKIELPAAGPYTVCRNNPVSLADPTGAISDLWWAIPSALSWSIQNTIASLFGMWFGLDFSPIGMIADAATGRNPFDLEWVTATNFGMFALRTDGWMAKAFNAPNAFTYQFFMSQQGPPYRTLDETRLFVPDDAFRPSLYGSLLHFKPANSPDFITKGQRPAPNGTGSLTDWSRCGGVAEPAFPGSRIPVFPKGGIHFNTVQAGVTQQACTATEIVPGQITLFGTLNTSSVLRVPGTGLGLHINDNILLTDSAGVVEIVRVLNVHEAGAATNITIDSSGARLSTPPITVNGLSGQVGSEALTPIPGSPTLLNIKGSSLDYHPNTTAVRLSRGGSAVHFARIIGLEARLTLNSPLPIALGNSLRVRPATAPGNFKGKILSGTSFQVVSGGPVGAGTGVTVGPNATAIPAIANNVAGKVVTLDTDISSLGGAGTNITWRPLAPSAAVGVRAGSPEVDPKLTYTPDLPGTAPATPFVQVDGAGSSVRRIVSVDYDAIVMSQPRPDANPAAYTVDRFTIGALNVAGATIGQSQALAVNVPPPADVRAYEVIQFTPSTVTAGAGAVNNVALNGSTATTVFDPTGAAGADPAKTLRSLQVAQVIIVTPSTGPPQPATIRRLRPTITIDRALGVSADSLQAAKLGQDVRAFSAVRRGDRQLRVRPISAGNRIDMPRFKAGELVQVDFKRLGASQQRFARVDAVSGSTITYSADEQPVPADADVGSITVTRLVTSDPANGSARLGIDGKRVAANQIEFSAWQLSDFAGTPTIAVIDGASVFAVKVTTAIQPLNIDLAIGAVTGPVTLSPPPNRASSGTSLRFSSDGATLSFNDAPLGAAPGSGFIAAVPFVDGAATITGKLDNGTVRVPNDHENVTLELDRKKSVTDHELTHTLQAIKWGPLLLSYLPIFPFECLSDFTKVNGPTMSDYVSGTLSGTVLTAAGLQASDDVQVAQGGRAVLITLGAAQNGGFQLSEKERQKLAGINVQDGGVMVRRSLQPGANKVFKWISTIGQFFTLGGATNLLTIAGWAGLITWIIQGISMLAKSKPHGVSATLGDDKKTLTIAAGSTLDGVSTTSSVAVKSADQTFIRGVASVDGNTVVMQQAVPFTGSVEVSLYTLGSAMFGGARNFFPATVPDASKPAVLKLQSVGGQSLSLQVRDRIEIRTPGGASSTSCVASVNGDEVAVEDEVLLKQGQSNDLQVAKIGTDDAHRLEDALLDTVRMGWMNYVNDPWAQITRHFEPASLGGRIATSSLRYLFGTHTWMPLFLGYFWFDNAYKRPKGHLSNMEQDASHSSGDTYSPIGSLHGNISVVGDVGRYWFTVNGGTRYGSGGGQPGGTPQDLINFGQQDAPGVNFPQVPVLSLGPATGPTFSQLTALPANSAPADFYQLNAAGVVQSIGPRGWVPVSPRLERSVGVQVAFTQPNTYKITGKAVGSSVSGSDISNADEAQQNNVSQMTFPITVGDVTVSLATLPVAEGQPFTLIPFQRAALLVTPNGSRVYRPTPAEPGFVVDVAGSDLVAKATIDTDDVEISRFHQFDAASNSFSSGITSVHLPEDLDIAVRRFQVQVIATIPFRATLDQTAPALATVHAGDTAFLLVPAQIAPTPFTTAVAGSPSPINPAISSVATIPAAVQGFLRDGGALQVDFHASEPPEENATLTVTIHVGPDVASAVAITAAIEIDPTFKLSVVGGAAFQVTKGDAAGITLQASDGTQLVSDTAIANVTVTPDHDKVNVTVSAGFTGGATIVVLVHDSANASRTARRTLTVV